MINAKEAREISKANSKYSLIRIESEIIATAKEGKTSFAFFAIDMIDYDIINTLKNLGYTINWYAASPSGGMIQYIISW
jgi:hypothetical protein